MDGFEALDELGRSVDGGVDVNGDGVDDVIVGAPFADHLASTPSNAGESYILSPLAPMQGVALRLSGPASSSTLEWTRAFRALRYNVYQGSLSTVQAVGFIRSSDMTAIACGIDLDGDMDGLPDLTNATVPAFGEGIFFLVTPENDRGEGALRSDGGNPARVHDAQCP